MKYVTYIIVILVVGIYGWKFMDYMQTKENNDRIMELRSQNQKIEKEIGILEEYLDKVE